MAFEANFHARGVQHPEADVEQRDAQLAPLPTARGPAASAMVPMKWDRDGDGPGQELPLAVASQAVYRDFPPSQLPF